METQLKELEQLTLEELLEKRLQKLLSYGVYKV
ncbi:MAG: acetyl-CoA carboxylase alpha subunit [Lysobacterales bacterium]